MATILVVDDDPANRFLLRSILHAHDVREAPSAADALRAVPSLNPDLIVLDLFMPEMSGAAFLKRLRSEIASDARVLLHTASTPDPAMRDVANLYKVTGFLPKPCEPEDVIRIVESALR